MAIAEANQWETFPISKKNLYVPVLTLSTQDNAKLLEKLKSGFKRTIGRNRFQSKVSIQRQNQYLDYLIDIRFQGMSRVFILSFENNPHRISYKQYFLLTVEIKDYNIMTNGKKFFWSKSKKWFKNKP